MGFNAQDLETEYMYFGSSHESMARLDSLPSNTGKISKSLPFNPNTFPDTFIGTYRYMVHTDGMVWYGMRISVLGI